MPSITSHDDRGNPAFSVHQEQESLLSIKFMLGYFLPHDTHQHLVFLTEKVIESDRLRDSLESHSPILSSYLSKLEVSFFHLVR